MDSLLRSIKKALIRTGVLAGTAAAGAVAAVLADPEAMTAIWSSVGAYGALIVLGLNLAGQTLADQIKHRGEPVL